MSSIIPRSGDLNDSQTSSTDILQLQEQFEEHENETFCLRPLDNRSSDLFILDDTQKTVFKLGKCKEDADFVIEDDQLANVQAILTRVCDSWVISKEKTLESSCLIEINGKIAKKSSVLEEADEIVVGKKGGKHFRFSFEKYDGQDNRKYYPECAQSKCHSRLNREFLCQDCMYRETEMYKTFRISGKTDKRRQKRYGLSPLNDNLNDGEAIKVPDCCRYSIVFRSKSEWKYHITMMMFARGNKGWYARCENYHLNPRSFSVNSQYPEDLYALLQEGDLIGIYFLEENKDDEQRFEFVALPYLCPDCKVNVSCGNCRRNKLARFNARVDGEEVEDPHYLVSISDENNCDFIRLLGMRMVIGNVTGDDLDHVLEFGPSLEVRVEFLRGRGGLWFANPSKAGTEISFYVNGNESSPCQLLKDGDVLQFGPSPNRPVYLFRYTAISKQWSFRLDSRVNIASINRQNPKTTNTRYDRQNCLEETRFVKLRVANCKEKINLKYTESKLFKRSLVVDNHEIEEVHDEIRLSNERNEYFLDWTKINNSNSRDFSQKVELLEEQSHFYVLDVRISNIECHNYHQNVNISSNTNRSKTVYLSFINILCRTYCHRVKLAPSGDENCHRNIRLRNLNCSNYHGEILVESENVQNFVHDVLIQNNWCEGVQQEVVLANKNVANGFLRIWLINFCSRKCFQKIVIDNINGQNMHVDIVFENRGSQNYSVDLRINNKDCKNITYKIKPLNGVVESQSYETERVRLTVSDLKSSETALDSEVKVEKSVNFLLNYCFKIGFSLGWYLKQLPTYCDVTPTSETYTVKIPRSLSVAIADSKPDVSELMEYIRQNHPNIVIENYGTVYGCMLSSGHVNVRATNVSKSEE